MINVINYLTFIVSTTFTYIMGILSKKYKWNDTLPIPLQNVLIGIIVFILAYAFCFIMKIEIKSKDILEQIIYAMGGVGTATLGYDTQKIRKDK